jgi:glc operon protein GlcG
VKIGRVVTSGSIVLDILRYNLRINANNGNDINAKAGFSAPDHHNGGDIMRYQIATIMIGLGLTSVAHAQTRSYTTEQPTLTYAGAQRILQAAAAAATARHAPSNIAVVDRAGDLLAFEHMDGAFSAGITLSMGKARSAARYQHPTAALEQAINTGRPAAITAGTVDLQGGVPIVVNGVVVGAIGVSGFDKTNDVDIADAAAKLP